MTNTPPVFVRRCHVCMAELKTPWGPETHSESEAALAAHIEHHSFTDLMAYALRDHGVRAGGPE